METINVLHENINRTLFYNNNNNFINCGYHIQNCDKNSFQYSSRYKASV